MPLSFIDRPRRSATDKVLMVLWWATLAGFAAMLALPFRFGLLRAGLIAAGVLLYFGAAYLLRRRPVLVTLLVAAPVAATAFLLSPGKSVDNEQLRARYVESLQSLDGTPYVWGGETRTGIDCSGLVRGAMTEANLVEGIATGNPVLLRNAALLWWHDESAKALGENDRGLTQTIASAKTLNDAPYSELRPGDIAVLASGIHTLAYLGDKTWIQADPKAMRVVRTVSPTPDGWFIQDVRLLRWTQLGAQPTQVAVALPRTRPQAH